MKNGSPSKNTTYLLKFSLLFLACLATFGDYYIMDIPAVLKLQLVKKFEVVDKEKAELYYSLLYTIYSLPNTILPLIGGAFTDIFGNRTMSLVFLFFIAFGQMIFSIGASTVNVGVMILGRFLFGVGGESLNITMTTFVIKWFQGSELSFSQGVYLSFLRSASILNAFLTPYLSFKYGFNAATYFGFVVCCVSLLSFFLLLYVDKIFERQTSIAEVPSERNPTLKEILLSSTKMNTMFWSLSICTCFFYISVLSFNTFLSGIIIEEWLPKSNTLEQNQETAGELMSIPFIMSSVLFPVVGVLVDKIGHRINLLLLAGVLTITAFMLQLKLFPFFPLILLGFSYSIFGAIVWPSVSYLVPPSKLGIGYGILTSIQNAGMGLAPIAVAGVKASYNTNTSVILFFIFMASIAFLSVIAMHYKDSQRNVSLNDRDQKKLVEYLIEFSKEDRLNEYEGEATSAGETRGKSEDVEEKGQLIVCQN